MWALYAGAYQAGDIIKTGAYICVDIIICMGIYDLKQWAYHWAYIIFGLVHFSNNTVGFIIKTVAITSWMVVYLAGISLFGRLISQAYLSSEQLLYLQLQFQ